MKTILTLACLLLAGSGCNAEKKATTNDEGVAEDARLRASPVEWVGVALTRTTDSTGFHGLVDGLFGNAAKKGKLHQGLALDDGLKLYVLEDERTDEQVIVEIRLDPSDGEATRAIARAPVSFGYGKLFIDTVDVALARTQQVLAKGDTMQPWWLEYVSTTSQGGRLILRADYDAAGDTTLTIKTESPQTSLLAGALNSAAFSGEPYEKIGGTVWFTLSRDEFSFFSERAYGMTSGANQNFKDFKLLPHDWLRLTVSPRPEDELVDVGFEVITLDGRRVPFAKAPASYVAGDQFRKSVFRMVDNMNRAMEKGGDSPFRSFEVPFHYDDPEVGGVVRVIASGKAGVFSIAYAVESPIHRLRDVDFLPYKKLRLTEPGESEAERTCKDFGSEEAPETTLIATFDASPTVRESPTLKAPLQGHIWGSVYRAEEVDIGGPMPGAVAVADFHFEDVDLRDPEQLKPYRIEMKVPKGHYQILGFMDIDGNAPEGAADPDVGDPVTLPIGDYAARCAEQPVVVEFALLLPPGR